MWRVRAHNCDRADDTALTQQRFTGSVFVQGAGEDASGVNADDITQGQLGDCYFLPPHRPCHVCSLDR